MMYRDTVLSPIAVHGTGYPKYVKTLQQNVDTLNLQLSEVLQENEGLRHFLVAILTKEKEITLSDVLLVDINYKKAVVTMEYNQETRMTTVKLQSQE